MDVREKLVELLKSVLPNFRNNMAYWGEKPIYEFADCLLANGVTVPEWISVKDRLPENIANRVLVVCERSNGVFYAHYEKPFWINLETDKPFISTVTHWMPLPSTEGLE